MELFDLVRTYSIPAEVTEALYTFIETSDPAWSVHHWTRETRYGQTVSSNGDDVEPKVSNDLPDDLAYLAVDFALRQYYEEFPDATATRFSHVRLTKYFEGSQMNLHKDHITSLFTFEHPIIPRLADAPKGIPVLSVVGLLKKADQGGEFIMRLPNGTSKKFLTEEHKVLVFPSIFPLMHEVTSIVKGTRISYVSWTHY